MPDITTFKDTTINGSAFRIHRLKADEGSWISQLLTAKMREDAMNATAEAVAAARTEKARRAALKKAEAEADEAAAKLSYEEGMYMTATFLVSKLARKEISEVQALCLSRISRMEEMAGTQVELAIIENGVWQYKELEYDGPTVLELTKQSLAFNIAPFFPAPASK